MKVFFIVRWNFFMGLNKKYQGKIQTLTWDQINYAHGLYQCGMSLSQVAKRIGSTRQRLHGYFKRCRLETRSLKFLDKISYNGLEYTKNSCGYWRKTNGDRETLHRQVWIDNNGPIPEGMEIHYIDENKDNNQIENLMIISTADHAKLHGFKNNQHTIKWTEDERIRRNEQKAGSKRRGNKSDSGSTS